MVSFQSSVLRYADVYTCQWSTHWHGIKYHFKWGRNHVIIILNCRWIESDVLNTIDRVRQIQASQLTSRSAARSTNDVYVWEYNYTLYRKLPKGNICRYFIIYSLARVISGDFPGRYCFCRWTPLLPSGCCIPRDFPRPSPPVLGNTCNQYSLGHKFAPRYGGLGKALCDIYIN